MVEKIAKTLNIKLLARDLRSKDDKQLLRTIMGQWLPVSTAVLLTVIEKLPSPLESQTDRLNTILVSESDTAAMDPRLLKAMKTCDKEGPVSAYVSKMLSIPREELPVESKRIASSDELMERSRKAREEALNAAKHAGMVENMAMMDLNDNSKNTSDLYKRAKDTVMTPK